MKILTLNKAKITDFSQERNHLLKTAETSWVLYLDQDETLSAPLSDRNLDKHFNYAFKRQDWFLRRKLKFGETKANRFIRLVQPGTGYWQGKVHEQFISRLPIKILPQAIIHRQDLSVSQFIDKLNYYSSLRAEELTHFSLFALIFYPQVKFVKNYFWHLGFLDGFPGFALAFLMSLHSLMVRVKQYETA